MLWCWLWDPAIFYHNVISCNWRARAISRYFLWVQITPAWTVPEGVQQGCVNNHYFQIIPQIFCNSVWSSNKILIANRNLNIFRVVFFNTWCHWLYTNINLKRKCANVASEAKIMRVSPIQWTVCCVAKQPQFFGRAEPFAAKCWSYMLFSSGYCWHMYI